MCKNSKLIFFTLISLALLSSLSNYLYLPFMPLITNDLATNQSTTQLTISCFLLGLTIARPIYGILSDRFGYFEMLLIGLLIYGASCIFCQFAKNIEILICGRILQALGASVGGVIGSTIAIKYFDEKNSVILLSYITISLAISPIIGPIIGSYMIHYFNWRYSFFLLAISSIPLVLLTTYLLLKLHKKESNSPDVENYIYKNIYQMLTNANYMTFLLINIFIFSSQAAYLTCLSFIFQQYHISPNNFGRYFLPISLGPILGGLMSNMLINKYNIETLIQLGIIIAILSSIGMLIYCYVRSHTTTINIEILFIMLYAISLGIVMPNSIVKALNYYPNLTGTASGLLGFIQMAFATIVSLFVGIPHMTNINTIAIIMFISSLSSLTCFKYYKIRLIKDKSSTENIA